MAVDIVERVRQRGHDLTLTLFGHPDSDEYGRRLDELARTRPWFRIERSLSREDLAAALARHRYGIHTMHEEHFGMAPAELQRAGCIPFVHNSGGAVEIVGRDPRLVFENAADAAEKIARTIRQPALEQQLREQVAARREWFSPQRFCQAIRELVWRQLRGS
jgi:glycosyltransferase involved in cell wall biosynthesis